MRRISNSTLNLIAPHFKRWKNDNHQLIIDEEVRAIVKEVFTRYLSRESMYACDCHERKDTSFVTYTDLINNLLKNPVFQLI